MHHTNDKKSTSRQITAVGPGKYMSLRQDSTDGLTVDTISFDTPTVAQPQQNSPQLQQATSGQGAYSPTPLSSFSLPPSNIHGSQLALGAGELNLFNTGGMLSCGALGSRMIRPKKMINDMLLQDKIREALYAVSCKTISNIDEVSTVVDSSHSHSTFCHLFPQYNNLIQAAERIQSLVNLPIDAILLSMLGAVSIASWGSYSVDIRPHWSEPAIDYIIIAAKSGTRKSALGNILCKPFDDFANECFKGIDAIEMGELTSACKLLSTTMRKINVPPLALSNEDPECIMDRLKEFAQKNANWTRKSIANTHAPRIFISETSQVALIKALVDGSGCLGILTTEGDFLKSDALFGKGSPAAFLKGHTMETLTYDSGKQGILLVRKPALPQVHFVQPCVIAHLIGKKHLRKNGVLQRFQIYLCPDIVGDDNAAMDNAVGDAALCDFQALIRRIISNNYTYTSPRQVHQLTLSIDARRQIEAFEREMFDAAKMSESDDLRAFILKSAGQAVRFAADLHLLTHPDSPCESPIEAGEIQAGICLVRILLPHTRALYSRHGLIAREHAQRILRWIADWRDKASRFARANLFDPDNGQWHQFTAREVQQGVTELKSDHSLVLAALDVLEQHGWLAQIPTGKNGRLCVLNPRAWGVI